MNPILVILCVNWAQMATFGGSRGGQKSVFLGPKPTQDPMNNVFEQIKYLMKIFLDPRDPPTGKFFGPGPGRPGWARGDPTVVKIVPLGL